MKAAPYAATGTARPQQHHRRRVVRTRDPHRQDTGVLEQLRTVAMQRPTYGYRRLWALLRRQRRAMGLAPVNAKRVYRLAKTHKVLHHDIDTRSETRHCAAWCAVSPSAATPSCASIVVSYQPARPATIKSGSGRPYGFALPSLTIA